VTNCAPAAFGPDIGVEEVSVPEMSVYGEVLTELLEDRGVTVEEMVARARELGYRVKEEVLRGHMVDWHTEPSSADYIQGPLHALRLGPEDGLRLSVGYILDQHLEELLEDRGGRL
jgi:hypothetical protein